MARDVTTTVAAAQRRVLVVLVCGQLFAGAGLAAGVTVGALLADQMFGRADLAGVPSAMLTAGSAVAAILVGRFSQARGRRPGLVAGFTAGAVGALGVVAAAQWSSIPLLVVSFLVYGAGTATNLQARYAGADLAAPGNKARAVSTVLVGTTAGAVLGPNLVGVTGELAGARGLDPLAGPFLLAAAAYGAAAVVLAVWLRPDPLVQARRFATAGWSDPLPEDAMSPGAAGTGGRSAVGAPVWTHAVLVGVAVMALTQFVMVALMTMTPVHMAAHGHGVSAVGVVISLHIAAMYLPAPLSGKLVDLFGPHAVACGAGIVLLAAGTAAALAPADSAVLLAVSLSLLGLGWSMGLVAGTAVLASDVDISVRATVQGRADVAIALAGAAGGLGSGVVSGWVDYTGLAALLAAVSLVLVGAVAANRPTRHHTTNPQTTNNP